MSRQVINEDYSKYDFKYPDELVFKSKRGLTRSTVEEISKMKNEPEWMRNFRLKAYDYFMERPMPNWGGDLSTIDFDNIYYYAKPTDKMGTDWKDLPENIRKTFDKLGIPEAERKFLGGVGAQYESEVVYHSLREDLEKKGVIFLDTDSALKQYPDMMKRYFGTIIPPNDNKFAALNSAVWSGGSFVYIPPGVKVEVPLQAYFRINGQNIGQFERTLIIAEPGAEVHYIEGCTAPIYSSDSLHAAVVEIIARKGAKVRYTTIQNWSRDVYNLVTKRAYAYEDATVEWVDGNLGQQAHNEISFYLPRWSQSEGRSTFDCILGERPAPRRGRKNRSLGPIHYFENHEQIGQQRRWKNHLQGIASRGERRERSKVKCQMRCTPA